MKLIVDLITVGFAVGCGGRLIGQTLYHPVRGDYGGETSQQ